MSSWQTDAIIDAHAVLDEVLPPSDLSLGGRVRAVVKRCNAHADLLAACKAARSLLAKLGGKNHDPEYSELVAAIAKAESVPE